MKMQETVVRIQEVQINNIKNVGHGSIKMSNYGKTKGFDGTCSITGIYGQNGSGKTALVDVMSILKHMLQGLTLPDDICKYLMFGETKASLLFRFYIEDDGKKSLVDYEFIITKLSEDDAVISEEKITVSFFRDNKWTAKKPIFSYSNTDKQLFSPNNRYKQVISQNEDNYIQLKVAKELSHVIHEEENQVDITSFLFAKKTVTVLKNALGVDDDLCYVIEKLSTFSRKSLMIIENKHFGLINLNSAIMPFHFRTEIAVGGITINIAKTNLIPEEVFSVFENVIEQINTVIQAVIPGLTLSIYNKNPKLMKDGINGISFELTTKRGNTLIPLQYESAGIKKLISILSNLIALYNNSSICLVIDELDAGIYEYLLGEILDIVQQGAKGQLIFTSHNLRALEVLRNEFLVFTTTNPHQRYRTMTYVKSNNNKRSLYLREVYLGGEDESLYNETNRYEISHALRIAGRAYYGEG